MSSSPLTTPVAFFVFNRPDTTAQVFAAIRAAKPARLLVVADGPRAGHPTDAARSAEVRAICSQVDWPCELATNFATENLGCKQRFATGLKWVFENAEEAIILEDDCLPGPSFFGFCQELLARYRDDPRIFLISGDNFLGSQSRNTDSYYFSAYSYTWGWASWRRSFALFDIEIKTWPEARRSGRFERIAPRRDELAFWTARFDEAYSGRVNTWDYQLFYAGWYHDLLTVVPEKNLVSNIGVTADASHTILHDEQTHNLPLKDIWQLHHPEQVVRDVAADRDVFERIYKGKLRRVLQVLKRGYRSAGLPGLLRASWDVTRQVRNVLLER